jgi:hypothetical protein
MDAIDVYIPNPGPAGSESALGIDAKSGIVGRRIEPDDPESPVLIYFEGNRFDYANVVTFADRCMVAAGRLTQDAPTIAKRVVNHDAVIRVGSYLPEYRRVELEDGASVTLLAAWLRQGHFTADGTFVPELDADDLRCSS